MSRTACYLGKSLACTINHSDQRRAFRISPREMNRFVDAQSFNQYEYFQTYDAPYRFLEVDELQNDDLLALDFANISNISDKCNTFYFNDTEEEKIRAYPQEDAAYARLDTDIISQQFCEMEIDTRSFCDIKLKEVDFESSGSPDHTASRTVTSSLLEKLAGMTKAEMVYMLEKNRLKYQSLTKCNVSTSCDL